METLRCIDRHGVMPRSRQDGLYSRRHWPKIGLVGHAGALGNIFGTWRVMTFTVARSLGIGQPEIPLAGCSFLSIGATTSAEPNRRGDRQAFGEWPSFHLICRSEKASGRASRTSACRRRASAPRFAHPFSSSMQCLPALEMSSADGPEAPRMPP